MSRVIGIDLGARRIGVARSDELALTAQPRTTIARHGGVRDLQAIAEVVTREGASAVVLGLPLDPEGEGGAAARGARAFAERLRAHLAQVNLGVPVELIDESFS